MHMHRITCALNGLFGAGAVMQQHHHFVFSWDNPGHMPGPVPGMAAPSLKVLFDARARAYLNEVISKSAARSLCPHQAALGLLIARSLGGRPRRRT